MNTRNRPLLLLLAIASGLFLLPHSSLSGADPKRSMDKLVTNSIGMKLVLIPAGESLMGSPNSDRDADDDEHPQHRVKIAKPFYLGATEVTQEQYQRVMGENPSYFKSDSQRPVEEVSWKDAVEFCRRLSEKEGKTYRLPMEAEWEYACRAGSMTKWCFGDSESQLRDFAWYYNNSERTTQPVGQKQPNAWGLYDMHGNVWEWCLDRYDDDYYGQSASTDPTGPSSGSLRVLRGGSWLDFARHCRSAFRYFSSPGNGFDYLGFRVCLVPPEQGSRARPDPWPNRRLANHLHSRAPAPTKPGRQPLQDRTIIRSAVVPTDPT